MTIISSFAAALASMLMLDALWLGVLAPSLYRAHIGHLLAPSVYWPAAVAFYVLYCVGIVSLIVLPHAREPLWQIGAWGALLGLVAYGTYDLTNQAVMKEWPVLITIIDMAWGTFLTCVMSVAAAGVYRYMSGS